MTDSENPQRCPHLLVGGMSVMCRDSFSPSRCMCDHQVCPDCWGVASHSSASEPVPPLVPDGTIISVDEDCNITRYDGSTNPCQHRPAMTFIDCRVGYLPHGECPKWNYNHREDGQRFIVDVATIRKQARAEVLDAIERFTFTCMWFNAPDCPGASNGECMCDDCERFEYSSPEDVRNYIKFLRQQEGKP